MNNLFTLKNKLMDVFNSNSGLFFSSKREVEKRYYYEKITTIDPELLSYDESVFWLVYDEICADYFARNAEKRGLI